MLAEKDLAFLIDHEVLLITTADVGKEKMVTFLYPVGDLIDSPDFAALGKDPDDALVEAITATVQPVVVGCEWWPLVRLRLFAVCKVLVISLCLQTQAPRNPRDVVVASVGPQELARIWGPVVGNSPVLRVYWLPWESGLHSIADEKEGQQMVEMVRKLIAPKSWAEAGAYISFIHCALVVRQTPDVHRRIEGFMGGLSGVVTGYAAAKADPIRRAPKQASSSTSAHSRPKSANATRHNARQGLLPAAPCPEFDRRTGNALKVGKQSNPRSAAGRTFSCRSGARSRFRSPGRGDNLRSKPSTRRLLTYAPPCSTVRRASPLLLARPASTRASTIFKPGASNRERGNVAAGDIGEDFRQLRVAKLLDLGAEEDIGRPAGGGQARLAMHQPRQLLGQTALAFAGLGLGGSRGVERFDLFVRKFGQHRKQRPASASSTLIQY